MAQRTCIDCGTDVSHLHHTVRRCPECCADIMKTAGLEPLEPYPGCMQKWRCRCMGCNREREPLFNNILKGQGGCARCAGHEVDPDEAAEVMRAAGLEPLAPYTRRHDPWPCRCYLKGHYVSPAYGAIRAGGGCADCNDTRIDPEVARAAMLAVGLRPLRPYPGSIDDWDCLCLRCGEVVSPCYSTVQRGMGGCRWCRNSGFKAAEAAIAYLIVHEGLGAAKIGIADTSGVRMRRHERRGWVSVVTVNVPGKVAEAIENYVLDWWRIDLGLPPYLGRDEMPHGGWTETVELDGINIVKTVRRMRSMASG